MKKEDTIELIKYITSVGKELVDKSGKIKDIGIKKDFLTEEDLRIEREMKDIINKMPGVSQFYAESENDNFIDAESVWVADPISGTKLFIEGLKHYAIVASHITKDAFPELAGCLIANESGLTATNIYGDKEILPSDRVFVCGNKHNYNDSFEITKDVIDKV